MSSKVWIGTGRSILRIPSFLWKRQILSRSKRTRASLGFMSEEHHLVREYAVRELPRAGAPLSVDRIAGDLSLPEERVDAVLADLEKHMTFVCRDAKGAVEWAYPVTVHQTPHEVAFSTGERLYSA
jgi:hypothetical protein